MIVTVRSRNTIGEVRQKFEDAAAGRKFGVISTALPCRVSIYEERGDVVLETLRPTELLQLFGEPSLEPIAREVEAAITEIMKEAAG